MAQHRVEPPLAGYTVVDLSTGIAGAYCTKLLADGGASVVKVEPPEGDPLRSWSASGAAIPAGGDGALFSFLAGAKHSVVADPAERRDVELVDRLLAAADAVVWSAGSKVAEHPNFTPARDPRPPSAPHGHVDHARSGWKAPGATAPRPSSRCRRGRAESSGSGVASRSGHRSSSADRSASIWPEPTRARPPWRRDTAESRAGHGELLDLSMLETQILCLTYYPVTYFEMLGPAMARRPTPRRCRVWLRRRTAWWTWGVEPRSNGSTCARWSATRSGSTRSRRCRSPSWPTSTPTRSTPGSSSNPVDEIRELATAFRIPNAPVANGANIASLDQFVERGSFVRNPRDGFRQPGHPVPDAARAACADRIRRRGWVSTPRTTAPRICRHGPHRPACAKPLPFSGLRVLDMTTFWAGPCCTHFLAMLGAEVIHVESTRRPDGTRLIAGVPITEDQWWEKSPIFAALNTNKKGLTLDLQSPRGRELLRRLIATCDVVVENFTPRVLDQMGLDFAAVQVDSARRGDGADARLRPRRAVARQPGIRLCHRGRVRPELAHRLPRPHALRPVFDR